MRPLRRLLRFISTTAIAVGALSTSGCVDSYHGTWMEFVLGRETHIPGDTPGAIGGRPPSGTHYEFWVVTGGRAFYLQSFEVTKQLDPDFPCFIEDAESKFPGLHTTMWYEKNLEDVLSDGNPTEPEGEQELGQIADAFVREERLFKVSGALKAVVGTDPTVTPAILTALANEVTVAAPITETDAASNARRLAICNAFFAEHPRYYVGQDKVFSLPLNGEFIGMVDGQDPRNSAPVGGAGFAVPVTFEKFDYLWLTWQFNDPQDARIPLYGPSTYGYHYMSGVPEHRTRRTINVRMQNEQFPAIGANVAVFPGIDQDNIQF